MASKTKGASDTGDAGLPAGDAGLALSNSLAASAAGAAEDFKILTDLGRVKILLAMGAAPNGEAGAADLAKLFPEISQPNTSQKMGVLRRARFIEARRSGKNVFYTLTARGRAAVKAITALTA